MLRSSENFPRNIIHVKLVDLEFGYAYTFMVYIPYGQNLLHTHIYISGQFMVYRYGLYTVCTQPITHTHKRSIQGLLLWYIYRMDTT